MSKEKKTRFYAVIDGAERVLFSVKQNSNGDITITSPNSKLFEPSEQNYLEFENQHYSVHESNGGLDTTITQKTQLVGAHYSICTFIAETKDHLLWPVFARRYPRFETENSLLTRKSREKAIEVTRYSYAERSLLYSVFASRPSFDVSLLKNAGIDFKSALFENHLVIVIPYFINGLSFPNGDVVGMSSSSTVIDGERSDDHVQYDVKSITPENFLGCNAFLMQSLYDHFIYRIKKEMADLGLHMPIFEKFLQPTQQPLPSSRL